MKLTVSLGLIALSSTLAAAQPGQPQPQPQGDPAPYPAPPPEPAPYPQPYPQPQPQPYPQPQQYPPQQYPPQGYVAPVPYGYAMPEPVIDGPKSTGTAVALSLGATFGPPLLASALAGDNENRNDSLVYGLLITSAVLGPSAGRIYAGDFLTAGLGVRAAGMAAILVGANTDDTDDAVGYIVIGSIALIGGAIADFAGTGAAVREYNFEHAKRTMTPMVVPTMGPNGGTTGAQVGLAGTF